jgi:hypothetical protein
MKPIQTALAILVAMLVGAAISYWVVRPKSEPLPNVPSLPTAKAMAAESKPEPAPPREKALLDEATLDAAVADAKRARKLGQLKPLANTPEEFARALGAFNYRLFEFASRYAAKPADGTPEKEMYAWELKQLTEHYANLVSDETLLGSINDDAPDELAHIQAHLASGALNLDLLATGKLESILKEVYGKLPPVENANQDLEARLNTTTKEVTERLAPILTPEQKKRLDEMGIDQVLFGLPEPEP